jgi:hypothetical protein
LLLRQAEVQRKRDEPLLNSVVQVALDQTPCLVAGGHDPGTRGGDRFAALLQGTCHRVEAAFEYTDLAGASVRSARAEVSAGEPARHRGGLPDGSDDRPRQIAREHDDEEHRSGKTTGRHGDSSRSGCSTAPAGGRCCSPAPPVWRSE